MPQPFAFRAAWVNIMVYNPETGQTQRFDAGQTRGEGKYLPYFSSMTVKTGLAHNSEVAVVLCPPRYEDFIDLIESPWVRLYNSLGVRWGYTDDPSHVSPWYWSFMKPPTIGIDVESFSITLNGTGFEFSMMRKGSAKVWASEGGTPGPRSLMDVIKEIVSVYGMPIVLNNGKPFPKIIADALNEPRKSLVQSGVNDWAFIRKSIEPLGLWMFVAKGFEIHILKGNDPEPPSRIFRVYGKSNPADGIWPAWGYSTETNAMFLPGRGVAATTFGPNADRTQKVSTVEENVLKIDWSKVKTKGTLGTIVTDVGSSGITIPRDAKDQSTLPQDIPAHPDAGGAKASVAAAGNESTERMPLSSQQEDGQAIAFGKSDNNVEKTGQTAEFESIDDPTLLPGDLVRMEMTGKPFEGNHRVQFIEHRIGGGEFGVMHLTVMASGIIGAFANPKNVTDAASAGDKPATNDDSDDKSADKGAGV
jgi:hypothetical protein